MAFDAKYWNAAVEGYGRSVWMYESSADSLATCAGSGYFNSVAASLKNGDVIIIAGSDSTGIRRVSSATQAATVTVAALG